MIAIIAILAALLVEGLAAALRAANSARCQSNLHQIGIASRMYVDDYHRYPIHSGPLEPYLTLLPSGQPRSQNAYGSVWTCPSYARYGGVSDWAGGDAVSYGYNRLGYMGRGPYQPHGLLVYRWGGPELPHGIREADVVEPSDMIEFGDATVEIDHQTKAIEGFWDLSAVVNLPANIEILDGSVPKLDIAPYYLQLETLSLAFYRQRHGGRWNLLFCDGHVEKNRRPKDVFDTKKPEQMARWNRDHLPHTDPSP